MHKFLAKGLMNFTGSAKDLVFVNNAMMSKEVEGLILSTCNVIKKLNYRLSRIVEAFGFSMSFLRISGLFEIILFL